MPNTVPTETSRIKVLFYSKPLLTGPVMLLFTLETVASVWTPMTLIPGLVNAITIAVETIDKYIAVHNIIF